MIKYLKFLWKKCFGSMGDSRIKKVRATPDALPVLILKPRPTHCLLHNRFKKSCFNCQEAIR